MSMSLLVTKEAPNFIATAVMSDNSFARFSLSSMRGMYVVLFFYPLDFTFVCPSEILAFEEALDKFREREAEVVGVSVDSEYTHLAWKKTPVEKGGIGQIRYPLVSDLNKNIARDYGVLLADGTALRGLFLIDKEGIVRHCVINDDALGRSVPEALRMVDALRFHERSGNVCPANWEEGKESLKPTTEGVVDYLSKFGKKRD
ncbi:MAG: peroxiredoxin [candidate division Zixibacteria bacterium]|nr:peroxiredoxin [candidate division Zixibacteria bacterium]NIR66707.1 peroxiredoxin [candidate division Zixibacteria bacterium]NIS14896.1 peroxiredoxin [candidate division Zixibacteria bacterium]NIS48246.1 peroxiredoxin [candidate division Zixibacteria bacterium]NIT51415.1 peroxiredoxin [candidate division Zixibacteria bacterium]